MKKIDVAILQLNLLVSKNNRFTNYTGKKNKEAIDRAIAGLLAAMPDQNFIPYVKMFFLHAKSPIFIKSRIIEGFYKLKPSNKEKQIFEQEIGSAVLLTNNFDLYERYFSNKNPPSEMFGDVFVYKLENAGPSHVLNKLVDIAGNNLSLGKDTLEKTVISYVSQNQMNKSTAGKYFIILYLLARQKDKTLIPLFEDVLNKIGVFLKKHKGGFTLDKEIGKKAILQIIESNVAFREAEQLTSFLRFSTEMNFLTKSKKMQNYNDLLFGYVQNYPDKTQFVHVNEELAKYKKYKNITAALEGGLIEAALNKSSKLNKNKI